MDKEITKIADCLSTLKFRKCLVGGINEKDMWKQLRRLEECYEEVLYEERSAYIQQLRAKDVQLQILKDILSQLGYVIPVSMKDL